MTNIILLSDQPSCAAACALYWRLQGADDPTQLYIGDADIPLLAVATMREHSSLVVAVVQETTRASYERALGELGYAIAWDEATSAAPRRAVLIDATLDLRAIVGRTEAFLGRPEGSLDAVPRVMPEDAAMLANADQRHRLLVSAAWSNFLRDHPTRPAGDGPRAKVICVASPALTKRAATLREAYAASEKAFKLLAGAASMPTADLAKSIGKGVDYVLTTLLLHAADHHPGKGLVLTDEGRTISICGVNRALSQESEVDEAEKRQIATYCTRELIPSRSTLFVDGGHTTECLFEALIYEMREHRLSDIEVITDSVRILNLAKNLPPGLNFQFAGGHEWDAERMVMRGPATLKGIEDLIEKAKKAGRRVRAFLGASKIGPGGCFVESEAALGAKILARDLADKAYVVVTSGKYHEYDGARSFAGFDQVTLVTDAFVEKPDYVDVDVVAMHDVDDTIDA